MESEGEDLCRVKIVFLGADTTPLAQIVRNYLSQTPHDSPSEGIYDLERAGVEVKLTMLYSDGRGTYNSMTTTFFKDANYVFLSYQASVEKPKIILERWSREVQRYCDNNVTVVVLALTGGGSSAEYVEEAQRFANENAYQHLDLQESSPEACQGLVDRFLLDLLPTTDPFPQKQACMCRIL